MDTAMVLDFIVKTGVPAGLGVFVVMYLLRVIIPQQQQLFRETIKSEQDTHKVMMTQLSKTLEREGEATRVTLTSLDTSTKQLSQAVFKLYGQSMAMYDVTQNGVGDSKRRDG